VIIVAALLAAGAAVAAVALVSGGGGHEAQPTIVGGNPALGRSFASLTHETNVSCLDTQTKDVATGDPVFVCSGTRDGKEMPCRPIAWNGREAHYIDFWSNAFDNGNGAVTC
jgi:hypothetical protein